MKILIVGDVHNNFIRLNELISKTKPELIIQCGDFGVWPAFNKSGDTQALSTIKLQTAEKLLFCDGNHEDHWYLKDRTTDELEPGIFYMPRGSIYTLPDGRNIMFFGGADSIDKQFRQIGVDWFPEEVITQKDLINLPDIKIDIFITHTCPVEIIENVKMEYPEKKLEPSNYALSELWKRYKPDLWYLGHFHSYNEGMLMGTKWYALSAVGFGDCWWMWLPDK